VLDTNVLVSGLLSPEGPCARILALAATGRLTLVLDARILAEYELVMRRTKFGIDPDLVEMFLAQLDTLAEKVAAPPLGLPLPDKADAKFVECALAASAECVITGNARHFPAMACGKVRVLTPAQFLASAR
jgi:putative PIN family toxin of toxin-antitoxin system